MHEVKANQKHFEEAEHCCSVREAFLDIGDTNEWLEELDWEEDIPEDEPVQCCDDILDLDNEEPLCSLQLELVDDDEHVDSDVTDVVEEHDIRSECEVVVVVRPSDEKRCADVVEEHNVVVVLACVPEPVCDAVVDVCGRLECVHCLEGERRHLEARARREA